MHALSAFEAAARLGSFARAAEEISVTQSAISHRIRLLEEHVGAALFVRVHNQVVLTPQGERFLVGVRESMRQLAAATESLAAGGQVKLRITSAPAIASQILIPHLRELLEVHPELQLEIDTSTRLVDLKRDEFDVALRYGSGRWPGLESALLVEESTVALASPEYAARFGASRTLASLADATLIHSSHFEWESWLRAAHGPPAKPHPAGLTFQEVSAALDSAAHGMGVVLSNQLGSLELRSRGLLVPFVDEAVDQERNYYAVYRADSPRIEAIGLFVGWLLPVAHAAVPRLPLKSVA